MTSLSTCTMFDFTARLELFFWISFSWTIYVSQICMEIILDFIFNNGCDVRGNYWSASFASWRCLELRGSQRFIVSLDVNHHAFASFLLGVPDILVLYNFKQILIVHAHFPYSFHLDYVCLHLTLTSSSFLKTLKLQ